MDPAIVAAIIAGVVAVLVALMQIKSKHRRQAKSKGGPHEADEMVRPIVRVFVDQIKARPILLTSSALLLGVLTGAYFKEPQPARLDVYVEPTEKHEANAPNVLLQRIMISSHNLPLQHGEVRVQLPVPATLVDVSGDPPPPCGPQSLQSHQEKLFLLRCSELADNQTIRLLFRLDSLPRLHPGSIIVDVTGVLEGGAPFHKSITGTIVIR